MCQFQLSVSGFLQRAFDVRVDKGKSVFVCCSRMDIIHVCSIVVEMSGTL
jgi:hypothetical protein